MRYLKRYWKDADAKVAKYYEEYSSAEHTEGKPIPDWFVRLPNVYDEVDDAEGEVYPDVYSALGYLDPKAGKIYVSYTNGTYDPSSVLDADEYAYYNAPELGIASYKKSCEALVKDRINWELIDAIRDVAISEEILDKGYEICIRADVGDIAVWFGTVGDTFVEDSIERELGQKLGYMNLWEGELNLLKDSTLFKPRKVSYRIDVYDSDMNPVLHEIYMMEAFDERLKGMFPEEKIELINRR